LVQGRTHSLASLVFSGRDLKREFGKRTHTKNVNRTYKAWHVRELPNAQTASVMSICVNVWPSVSSCYFTPTNVWLLQ